MNEEELIAAFGGLRKMEFKPAAGQVKCLTESCPVMLTIECGRVYCRWCTRKRREALNVGDRNP